MKGLLSRTIGTGYLLAWHTRCDRVPRAYLKTKSRFDERMHRKDSVIARGTSSPRKSRRAPAQALAHSLIPICSTAVACSYRSRTDARSTAGPPSPPPHAHQPRAKYTRKLRLKSASGIMFSLPRIAPSSSSSKNLPSPFHPFVPLSDRSFASSLSLRKRIPLPRPWRPSLCHIRSPP